MLKAKRKLRLIKPSKKKGGGEMKLRVQRKLRKVGGGAAMPLPMDFLKKTNWKPGITELFVTLEDDGTITIKDGKSTEPIVAAS